MALSAAANYRTRDTHVRGKNSYVVANAAVIYDGALCSFDTTVGYVKPFDGTKTDRIAGFYFGDTKTGNTSAAVPPEAAIHPGEFYLENVACAGLSTTLSANVGAAVWATDDGTFTITDPSSTGFEFGNVTRNRATGYVDIYVRDIAGKIEP